MDLPVSQLAGKPAFSSPVDNLRILEILMARLLLVLVLSTTMAFGTNVCCCTSRAFTTILVTLCAIDATGRPACCSKVNSYDNHAKGLVPKNSDSPRNDQDCCRNTKLCRCVGTSLASTLPDPTHAQLKWVLDQLKHVSWTSCRIESSASKDSWSAPAKSAGVIQRTSLLSWIQRWNC